MRSFQTHTKGSRSVRRWWLWLLPVVAVAVVAGLVLAAGPLSLRTLGNRTGPDAGGVGASPDGWIERVLGGGGPLADGPLNVLVLGVDTRPDDPEMGSRTDTIMLVQVVPKTGEVKLLSVPRDLYVEVEPGEKDRINAAYNYGGIQQTVDALESYSGVAIDHYAIVDFDGFRQIIDAMDGVRVDVGQGVFPEKWHMGEGVQRLGGRKALFYARYRGTPRADLDRIDHQQKLLAALRRQAFRWNTVTKMPAILKTTNENVETDLGIWHAIPLARALIVHGRDGSMSSSELKGYPTTLDDGTQVLVPKENANEAILEKFRK